MLLAEEMPGHQDEWEELVRKFDLRAPVSLKEFVGQSFTYADFGLATGGEELPPVLLSTIKLRQAGFGECMDTEDMFQKWVSHFQRERLLPPSDW